MKYILINDDYMAGGAEVQSKRELEYFLQQGHEVLYITLTPDLEYHESKQRNHINLAHRRNALLRIKDRYICNQRLYSELCFIIDTFKPDFIHLNNIYLSAPAVFGAVEKIYCLQTVRDFSIVCVKSDSILPDGSVCRGIKYEKCFKQCMPKRVKELVVFVGRYLAIKRNEKLRRRSVNAFISPSQCLANYCNDHGFHTTCINNPFDFIIAEDFKKKPIYNEKKIYLYFGIVAEKKGVLKLIQAFNQFAKDTKDTELHIVGKLKNLKEEQLQISERICYLGFMSYAKIIEKLKSVYAVVVPSIWIENYPNTVLEGFATDCIVLGSDRGGIPEQIDDKNCIFDVMQQEDIIRCLHYANGLSERERQAVLSRQRKYIKDNNGQDVYYHKIKDMISKKDEISN